MSEHHRHRNHRTHRGPQRYSENLQARCLERGYARRFRLMVKLHRFAVPRSRSLATSYPSTRLSRPSLGGSVVAPLSFRSGKPPRDHSGRGGRTGRQPSPSGRTGVGRHRGDASQRGTDDVERGLDTRDPRRGRRRTEANSPVGPDPRRRACAPADGRARERRRRRPRARRRAACPSAACPRPCSRDVSEPCTLPGRGRCSRGACRGACHVRADGTRRIA